MNDPLIVSDVRGKVIVITGASAGIGAAAARRLARAGATVVPVGRSPERTRAIAAELGTEPVIADFGRLAEVRAAALRLLDRHPRIDVLANNAGGVVARRTITVDGNELSFQANHLAGFLLTTLLLDRLRENAAEAPVRVVNTSSVGHRLGRLHTDDLLVERRRYGGGWIVYCDTKLMNVMFTRELARRTAGTGITAASFNPDPGRRGVPPGPGSVDDRATNFAGDTRMMRLFQRVPGLRRRRLTGDRGAQALVWLATSPESEERSGVYYDKLIATDAINPQAKDDSLASWLWQRSEDLVARFAARPA